MAKNDRCGTRIKHILNLAKSKIKHYKAPYLKLYTKFFEDVESQKYYGPSHIIINSGCDNRISTESLPEAMITLFIY